MRAERPCPAHFDEELKVTAIIVTADRGITSGDVLAIDFGRDGDVLSDGETEDGFGGGEGEAVAVQFISEGILAGKMKQDGHCSVG